MKNTPSHKFLPQTPHESAQRKHNAVFAPPKHKKPTNVGQASQAKSHLMHPSVMRG